jgi:hypothetical protein
MATKQSAIESIYQRYEHLAKSAANKIYNFERYGYEKSDIIQEFKIKIYTSIIAYTEKWYEYRKRGRYKPVPIEFYIRSCMKNKQNDFIKLFNMERVESVDKVSIEQDGFDYASHADITSVMSLNDNVCEINGVDLFQGLVGRKRTIFSEYLSGVRIKEISEKFPMLDINNVIERQLEVIRAHKTQLLDFSRVEYTMSEAYED